MAITITGGKYAAAYVSTVASSTVTVATTPFLSGDFLTAHRIVGLWNAAGTVFKGYAHVRAWVSTNTLQLESAFFDPATGIAATQVVGDLVLVSKNFAECVVAGSLTFASNKATFLTNAIFGTANQLASCCFYDEGRVIEATVNGVGTPAIGIAGGLVVFGHLQDYATNKVSGGCFLMFTVNGSQAGLGPTSNSAIFCMHGGTINTLQQPLWNGGYYGTAAHTQVWNSVETYLDFMTPSIQPFNFNPTRQILRNVTNVIAGVAADGFRWFNGVIEGGTAKLIGDTSLAVFGQGNGVISINIGAPASQYYIVQDIQAGAGYFSTPCALWDNNTTTGNGTIVNWTNVITPERTVARYNTTTNANFNWYWKQQYTNCKPNSIIAIKRNVDDVIVTNTIVTGTTGELTLLEQKQSGTGRTPAVTEDYSSWQDSILCYGYQPISNNITRTSYSLGTAGSSNQVIFGGIVNQIADSNVTLSRSDALLLSTRININIDTNTITFGSPPEAPPIAIVDSTLDDLYDYLIAWKTANITNMQYQNIFEYPVTGVGNQLNLAFNIEVLSGTTLSNGIKFQSLLTTGSTVNSGTIDVDKYESSSGAILKLKLTNILVGSRVQVYNSTTSTEISNFVATNSTYELTYLEGTNISTGDIIRVRVVYQNGLTAKLGFESSGVADVNGFSLYVNQVTDDIYTAIGLDGSTLTEYTTDFTNIDINISDSDNATTFQRLYSWFKYAETSAQGIALFFGGLSAIDFVNYSINSEIVNLTLDNNLTTPLIITGGALTRTDGISIISTTSGSIQIDPSKSYLTNSGVITSDLDALNRKATVILATVL